MEEMLKQLVKDFGSFRQEVNGRFGNLESDVRVLRDSADETKGLFKNLESDVRVLRDSVDETKGLFKNLESDVRVLRDSVDETKVLTKQIKLTVDDSHKWIRAMSERQEVQNAETENLKYRVAVVEGVLQGVASSLEPVRKAR